MKRKYYMTFYPGIFGGYVIRFKKGDGLCIEVDDDCLDEIWDQFLAEIWGLT